MTSTALRTYGNYSNGDHETSGPGSKASAVGKSPSVGLYRLSGDGRRVLFVELGQMILMLNGVESTLSDFCDDDLRRAVYNSLFSWARASDSDELPGDSKQGWWGDTYADDTGDHFGSKLWLLSRAKVTQETLLKAQDYAAAALQWMIDDGIAKSVDVSAERGGADQLNLTVTIQKPSGADLIGMRFQDIWSE